MVMQMIYKYAVILRAYFETFGDIATMWKELSEENIIPGLKMIDGLSMESPKDEIANKVAQLSSWAQNASANIVSIASAKRKEIEDGMEERVEDIEQSTQSLPPSAPAKKVIEEAAKEVTTTAATAVKENAQNNPLSRFDL
jgi:beta-glucosidase/6-phospho-beta-glucosidase/beta-galactosidase